jgi:hypothetical protein
MIQSIKQSHDAVMTASDKISLEEKRREENRIKNIVSNDVADCPHKEIIELYKSILPMGTVPRSWDGNRAAQLKARWREDIKRQSIDWWKGFFEYISQSDFLTGKIPPRENYKQFVISMDFIIKASNFTKIRESGFQEYFYETVLDTYNRYPNHKSNFSTSFL